jgi:tetratricopeptide (TPR) repeat protein
MLLHTALLALSLQAGVSREPARAVVEAATVVLQARLAVEHDSIAPVAARWQARVRRDARDRAARLGLATLASYRYDYATADRGLHELLAAPGARPDPFAVRARLELAIAARVRGRFTEADTIAARAVAEARASADTAAEVEALLNHALLRGRLRGRAARDSAFAEAAPLIGAVPAMQPVFRCGRATSGPDPEDSLRAGAEQALAMGDRRTHAGCLFVLAQLQFARGTSRSVPFLLMNDALAEFTATHDRASAGSVLQWVGWYQTAQGSYGVGKENLERALRESTAAGDVNGIAWASTNLASVALRAGDLTAASAYLERAATFFAANGDIPGLTGAIGLRGDLARAAGDVPAARAAYRDALERHLATGNALSAMALHNGLADLALMESKWDEAQRELDAARELARARNLTGWEQGLSRWYADLALLRGDLATAERLLGAMLQSSLLPYRRYVTQAKLAEVHARRGDVAGAEVRLTAAMDTLDRWRAAQSDHDLRLAVFGIQESWADPDLGIATVLSAMAMNGRVESAFTLAERRRARDLLDHLLNADALRVEAPDTTVSSRLRPAAVAPAEIRALLPDDRTALLEFVTGRRGEPTTVFVLTRGGITARTLPAIDSLASSVARHVALIESGLDATTPGRALGAQLLSAALSALPAAIDRLIIVPDDALHRVPFDALLLADGRAAVERYGISITPSALTLRQVQARARPALPRPAGLVLADPAFATLRPDPESRGPALAFADAGGLGRLRYTADEAKRIARVFPGVNVKLRNQASEAFLRSNPLRNYRILHFATHAVVDERAQSRTGLALAPGAGHDGFLGPGDLAALDLDADLVVLSACRTASGVVVRGEGVLGLTAPLIQAGARAVIATRWKVRDRAAADLVGVFYAALARGLPAGDALREAKLEALRHGAPPRDWAAFTLIGDPLVRPLPAPVPR